MKAKRSNKNCVLFKLGGAFERVIKRSPRLIFADDVIKERSTNSLLYQAETKRRQGTSSLIGKYFIARENPSRILFLMYNYPQVNSRASSGDCSKCGKIIVLNTGKECMYTQRYCKCLGMEQRERCRYWRWVKDRVTET